VSAGRAFEAIPAPLRACDRAYDVLTDEWQTLKEIAHAFGRSRSYTTELLGELVADGRAECRGSDLGGRGHAKAWRRAEGS
jgi:hypothetical protein